MTFLSYYLICLGILLFVWHLVISDQKRLKAQFLCQMCDVVLDKKETPPCCFQCYSLGLNEFFEEEGFGVLANRQNAEIN